MIGFATLSKFRRSKIIQYGTYITLLCFTVFVCNGCVSVKVRHLEITSDDETPSIAMKMFLKKPGVDGMDKIINGVQSTLFFKNVSGEFVQVSTSQNGQWILKNAPAGTYRMELAESFEHEGKIEKLSGSRAVNFKLPADKRAEIQVVLKRTPVGLIILLSVVIVGFIIVAILVADDLPDLPVPPVPPLVVVAPPIIKPVPLDVFLPPVPGPRVVGSLPPPPLFIDYGVYVAPHGHGHSHGVADHHATEILEAAHIHPHDGAVNVPVNTNIEIYFSVDIDERCLEDSSMMIVVGSESGPVSGEINYTRSEQKMEFVPMEPFAARELVRVKLNEECIFDSADSSTLSNYQGSFTVGNQ
jgi:hypothetical protein